MAIEIEKTQAAEPHVMDGIETAVGFKLPPDYVEFLSSRDGAKLNDNAIYIRGEPELSVHYFIPSEVILKAHKTGLFQEKSKIVIATDDVGNSFVLDAETGVVSFFDHEEGRLVHDVATSFGQFLQKIYPTDLSAIKLAPGQVKSSWIDPEFLKEIKRLKK